MVISSNTKPSDGTKSDKAENKTFYILDFKNGRRIARARIKAVEARSNRRRNK